MYKKLLGKLYLLTINCIPTSHKSFFNKIKRVWLKNVFNYIGKDVNIRPKIKFAKGSNISIGNRSGIGEGSFLQDVGEILIGDNVLMGDRCMIFTSNHAIQKDKLIIDQPSITGKVIIEDDVWIGAGVIILSNVTIKKGAVIGAGSVVTKNVEQYEVVAGVPAKNIKYRE